jgi:hypothetical protein
MILYAVREMVPYESYDIIALFTTMAKAVDFMKRREGDFHKMTLEQVLVDSDAMVV